MNNTSAAVSESVQVGGATLAVSLPAGPYVRVAGTGVTLRVAGQRLSGDFSFERVAVTGGNAVRITVVEREPRVRRRLAELPRPHARARACSSSCRPALAGTAERARRAAERAGRDARGHVRARGEHERRRRSRRRSPAAPSRCSSTCPPGSYPPRQRLGRDAPRRAAPSLLRQLHLRAHGSRERHLDDDDGGSDRVRRRLLRSRRSRASRRPAATRSRSTTSSMLVTAGAGTAVLDGHARDRRNDRGRARVGRDGEDPGRAGRLGLVLERRARARRRHDRLRARDRRRRHLRARQRRDLRHVPRERRRRRPGRLVQREPAASRSTRRRSCSSPRTSRPACGSSAPRRSSSPGRRSAATS